MILYKISTPFTVFRFKYDPVVNDYDLSNCQTPEEFTGPDAELMEDLQDIDGTKFDVAPLTAGLGGLVIREELAPKLRDYLNEHGCIIAERRIISPLDTYVVFGAFNLYNDNPDAPLFRLWHSPDVKELSMSHYASVEFMDWLNENFDTRGLTFHQINREEPYAMPPKKTSEAPKTTDTD